MRVVAQYSNEYRVFEPDTQIENRAVLSGGLTYRSNIIPVVGDWVEVIDSVIVNIENRANEIGRKSSSSSMYSKKQVFAANIDLVIICTSLNDDLNERRIERYLSVAKPLNCEIVIVLTKSDLLHETFEISNNLSRFGEVILTSTYTLKGIEAVREKISNGKTAIILGSSGVGKSSLVNALLGSERMKTGDIRSSDSKGRHTTTHKELIYLDNGGAIIDTPGIRSLSIDDSDVSAVFPDIESLIDRCAYSNCSHTNENGCEIKRALSNGLLDHTQWKSYCKLKKEEQLREKCKKMKKTKSLNYSRKMKHKNSGTFH